jgi:hypothetical protein
MKKVALALIAALMLFGANEAAAQDPNPQTVQANATLEIAQVLYIGGTGLDVTFPVPTAAHFAAGSVDSDATTVIETRGNVIHEVNVRADAASLTGDGVTKPASDLQWSASGAEGSFLGLMMSPADVVTGLARGVHENAAEIWYRMALDYETDAPGIYTLTFTYTVVAQ